MMRVFLVSALLLPTVLAISQIPPQLKDSIARGEVSVCPEGVDAQDCIELLDAAKQGHDEKEEVPIELEEKLSELDQLHEQLFALEDRVWEKENEIVSLLEDQNDDSPEPSHKHLKEELAQCDSIKCVLHAIFKKAHHKLRKLKAFFHRHHPGHRHHRHRRPWHCGPPRDDDGPPPPPHHRKPHHGGPPEGGRSFGDRFHRHHHRHHHKGRLFLLLGVVFFAIILMAYYRRRCCCNPRHITDRIAARIERRNALIRRRQERREKFRSWIRSFATGCSSGQGFHGWCRSMLPRRFSGPREKTSVVIEQEALLHEHMQAEIRELRNATSMVDSMVNAEEGRSSFNSQRATRPRGRWSSSLPRYRDQSGPSELGPPPDYESEVNTAVVDGFQYDPDMIVYTPSGSEDTSSESRSSDQGSTDAASDGWKN